MSPLRHVMRCAIRRAADLARMCGRHRKRPAAEEADDDDMAVANSDVDQSSAYAVTMQNMRGRVARGPILGPYAVLTPPVPVYVGAPRPGSDAAVQIAARPANKKRPGAAATTAAAAPKNNAKPASVNASAGRFSLTPSVKLPGTGTFAPASADQVYRPLTRH